MLIISVLYWSLPQPARITNNANKLSQTYTKTITVLIKVVSALLTLTMGILLFFATTLGYSTVSDQSVKTLETLALTLTPLIVIGITVLFVLQSILPEPTTITKNQKSNKSDQGKK